MVFVTKNLIYCYFTNTWKSEVTSQKTECVNFKKTCSLHKLKYKMYAVYKTFLLWESEVGKISPFFETFFLEMTSSKNFECLLHHGDAFGRIFIFSVTFSISLRK